MDVTRPGQVVTMDVVPNSVAVELTKAKHSSNYLLVCDVFSKFTTLLPLEDSSSDSVAKAVNSWIATYQSSDATFYTGPLEDIRSDAGTEFTSEEFQDMCNEREINFSFASPRHQEMNGLAERIWRSIRDLAFSMMVHVHVGDEFYDYALNHA